MHILPSFSLSTEFLLRMTGTRERQMLWLRGCARSSKLRFLLSLDHMRKSMISFLQMICQCCISVRTTFSRIKTSGPSIRWQRWVKRESMDILWMNNLSKRREPNRTHLLSTITWRNRIRWEGISIRHSLEKMSCVSSFSILYQTFLPLTWRPSNLFSRATRQLSSYLPTTRKNPRSQRRTLLKSPNHLRNTISSRFLKSLTIYSLKFWID